MKASGQKPGTRQVHCDEYRRDLELRARKVMAENQGISLNRLREIVRCGNGTLSTIYNRVRRGE